MSDAGRRQSPLVSIVTPSYNQVRYLPAAIDSVLAQDYPNIEYLVVDAESTDGTLDVLRACDKRVSWVSEPDDGQSDALNKGFRTTRGEIVAWLNADDLYEPGAVSEAVRAFAAGPAIGLVYGNASIVDEAGRLVRRFEEVEPVSLWRLLHMLDYIPQPAAFFRRSAAAEAGWLDDGLEFAMDWDLWIRLAAVSDVRYVDQPLARARVHPATKTATGGWRRIRELKRLARKHTGTGWTPGTRLYMLDTVHAQLTRRCPWIDRPFGAARRRISARIVAGAAVHADGWLGPTGRLVVPRRWRRASISLEAHRLPDGRELTVAVGAAGRTLVQGTAWRPGPFTLVVPLPDGDGPFVELEITTNVSFRDAAGRRLAVRCVELAPADSDA